MRKAQEAPLSLVHAIKREASPWLLLISVGGLSGLAFGLDWPARLYLAISLGAVAVFGILFVARIFIAEGVARYREAKRRED